jgi:CubicO group peptidase (beta-lactamase class C family)
MVNVEALHELAVASRFSGVVRVDVGSDAVWAAAYGLADRAHGIPNTLDTRFAIASGTKGVTALTVMRLVEQGTLRLDTPVRSVLGPDLPLIDDRVTVEHLLAHRSGIGDYLDESLLDTKNAYVMRTPVHLVDGAEAYVAELDGFPQVSEPGALFVYNNGGYVVLALVAERVAATPYHQLVHDLVLHPAGMSNAAFLRSDSWPGDTAIGYLDADGLRTNVLHIPVVGVGDGGLSVTLPDVHAFWQAFWAGRIVSADTAASMVTPLSTTPSGRYRYGLGFWLSGTGDLVELEGADAGISFRTVHCPSTGVTATVMSNVTDTAWPLADALRDLLDTAAA